MACYREDEEIGKRRVSTIIDNIESQNCVNVTRIRLGRLLDLFESTLVLNEQTHMSDALLYRYPIIS